MPHVRDDDIRQPRPIVVFYANRTVDEFVYNDVLEQAWRELGIRTVYTITEPRNSPKGWGGRVGHVSAQMIREEVPDYQSCVFYLSGPPRMVDEFRDLLVEMGVHDGQIKTDLFAGLA